MQAVRLERRFAPSAVPAVERLLRWGVATAAVALGATVGLLNSRATFFALTALLIGYGADEMISYVRGHRERLVSPVVVATLMLFIIPFGITNLLYLLPARDVPMLHVVGATDRHLVIAQALAFLGLVSMWLGYRAVIGQAIGRSLCSSPFLERLLRTSFNPSLVFIVLGMAISIAGRLALVRLGLFGYSSEAEQLVASASIAQWVRMCAAFGPLVLSILALGYYGTRRPHLGLLLALWLVHEVAWGVLAAFKAEVIMPFLIVGVCRFVVERRVPVLLLVGTLAALTAAYAVVEPLRYLRYADPDYETRSVVAIADAAVGVARGADESVRLPEQTSLALVVAARLHLTAFAARAIEYSERGPLQPDAPRFLRNLLLAPLYAVVPRFLMPSKASATTGAWFSTAVLGWSSRTSVGMSAVGYLFLAGGAFAVLVGFLVLGILQRLSFDWLFRPRSGTLVVFLVALVVTANVDPSEFWAVFTGFIRHVPLAIVAQALAFRS